MPVASAQPGRAGTRSPRATATRRRLMAAGRRAFAERGLVGTNLREHILGPADVSVGSFYHQFTDKTELLLAILEEHSRDFRARLDEVHTPVPDRSLHELIRASYAMAFRMAEQNEDLLRIELRERFCGEPRVTEYLDRNRERWIESLAADYARLTDPVEPTFDFRLLATLVVGITSGTLAHYLELSEAERRTEKDRLLDGLVRFTIGGAPALAARGVTTK